MEFQSPNRFERWLGVDADGGVSLREERVGRWIYAGVLGLLMLSLVWESALPLSARVGLAWYLGLSVTLVPLSWIGAHIVDDRRTLASWGASVVALVGGTVILVGLGQIGKVDSSVVTSPLGLWVISLVLFGLSQAPVIPQWRAFGDQVRDVLPTPIRVDGPAPVSTLSVIVTPRAQPTLPRRQPDHGDIPEKQGVV